MPGGASRGEPLLAGAGLPDHDGLRRPDRRGVGGGGGERGRGRVLREGDLEGRRRTVGTDGTDQLRGARLRWDVVRLVVEAEVDERVLHRGRVHVIPDVRVLRERLVTRGRRRLVRGHQADERRRRGRGVRVLRRATAPGHLQRRRLRRLVDGRRGEDIRLGHGRAAEAGAAHGRCVAGGTEGRLHRLLAGAAPGEGRRALQLHEGRLLGVVHGGDDGLPPRNRRGLRRPVVGLLLILLVMDEGVLHSDARRARRPCEDQCPSAINAADRQRWRPRAGLRRGCRALCAHPVLVDNAGSDCKAAAAPARRERGA
mmetsp:Transcript_43523/g.123031  ORF Transcript_43523/g.123031 Transcript_43523/m.123031 type:complete len:313 (+) Transcript_43523:1014-1952(+)